MKGKGRQEDEKQRDENGYKPLQDAGVEEPWTLPYDAAFHCLITEAAKMVLPQNKEAVIYTALAK